MQVPHPFYTVTRISHESHRPPTFKAVALGK